MSKPLTDTGRQRVADDLAETATRIANALELVVNDASIIDRIRAAASPLVGTDYDPERQGQTPWCWRHQRSVTACWADDAMCLGEVVQHPSDPVGERAMTPNRAAHDLATLDALLRRAHSSIQLVERIVADYTPRKAVDVQAELLKGSEDTPGCEQCAKITTGRKGAKPTWNPPHTKEPTTVNGRLPKPALLCGACYDFVFNVGRMPSVAETRGYVRSGKYVRPRVNAGKRLSRQPAPRSVP